ncbi:hypothetical protein BZA05DRAFT_383901 [Tricharina praecox]|uniref:uncharacterized protein n=1 Tax=Tricharina praecox TaxID=43433 RepID=UPI0022204D5D|nr:uncharacterized protein BZA05DRAFT_383901 [Tricharina praecox]KAI5857541.1 hypothetical protein BZA05DRAFT_383901 [Tricharina praecox]
MYAATNPNGFWEHLFPGAAGVPHTFPRDVPHWPPAPGPPAAKAFPETFTPRYSHRSISPKLCVGCGDFAPIYFHETPGLSILARRVHQRCYICLTCIQSRISGTVSGTWVRCPGSLCSRELSNADIRILFRANEHGESRDMPLPSPGTLFPATHAPVKCCTCLETDPSGGFAPRLTDNCRHHPTLCFGCLRAMLSHALDGKAWVDPACPDCRQPLSAADVKRFGTATQMKTFADRAARRFLQDNPDWLMCPNGWCGQLQKHEGGAARPWLQCLACGSFMCFNHRDEPYHAGLSCAEVDDARNRVMQEGIQMSEELVRSISKVCPNCQFDIHKTGGCEHMTCGKCKYEFCFLCLASYEKIRAIGNTAHVRSCAHYA